MTHREKSRKMNYRDGIPFLVLEQCVLIPCGADDRLWSDPT